MIYLWGRLLLMVKYEYHTMTFYRLKLDYGRAPSAFTSSNSA